MVTWFECKHVPCGSSERRLRVAGPGVLRRGYHVISS